MPGAGAVKNRRDGVEEPHARTPEARTCRELSAAAAMRGAAAFAPSAAVVIVVPGDTVKAVYVKRETRSVGTTD